MAAYYEGGAGKGLRAAAAAAAAMGMAMNVRDEELLGFPWLWRGGKSLANCPSSKQGFRL